MAMLLLPASALRAQEAETPAAETPAPPPSPWKKGLFTSLTVNQIAFKNWAAGGKNSFAGTALFKGYANYKGDRAVWDNLLELGYGILRNKGEDIMKADDKIHLSSTYGYDAAKQKLYYSAGLDFKTQFAKGWIYGDDTTLVSKFMAPGYLSVSLGLLWKPVQQLSVNLSPLTGRFTFVSDTAFCTKYGVDEGKKARPEFGATLKVLYDHTNIFKNVDYYLHANFFLNWLDHPGNIDVDIETGFNLKVNEWLTALVKVNMLFDDDIPYVESYTDEEGAVKTRERGARFQVKELVGVGVSFKLDK